MTKTQKEIDQSFEKLKKWGYPEGCSINLIEIWCWRCQKYTKTITSPMDWDEMSENCFECNADKMQGGDL